MRVTPGSLSVEVAEIDESWITHIEDWVLVDSGAGVSACPLDHAPECEAKHRRWW